MSKHLKYFLRLIVICFLSTIVSISLNNFGIGKENTLMVLLVGVLCVTSVTQGYIYGAVSSILSVLIFNFFFAEPIHSLQVRDANDFMLVIFFLIASLISSTMTSKFQHQLEIAKRNERTAQLIYKISDGFLNVTGMESIVKHGIQYILDNTGYHCRIRLDAHDRSFSTMDQDSARTSDDTSFHAIPIKGLANQIGTIEILNQDVLSSPENYLLIKMVVYQMALVLDREFIYNEREKIRIAMESEHLKSTLLRSISHDLRTPLTGIMGASGLILDTLDTIDRISIKKLVTDINEESSWLIKSVQNILDMTRISEGNLTVRKDYEAVDDLINEALTHVPLLTNSGRLRVIMPKDIVLVSVDWRLIVQVLVNLLDNAYKHAGEDATITLNAYRDKGSVVFEVSDNGIGIEPAVRDLLFEGFVTTNQHIVDGNRGVGLGLSICKAIVEAHGGSISGENLTTGGAIFKIVLPSEEE